MPNAAGDPITLDVQGICRVCGRQVIGRRVRQGSSQAVGDCPRCGAYDFYIDNARMYIEPLPEMENDEALDYVTTIDETDTIEALIKLEVLTHNRKPIVEALYRQYEVIDQGLVTVPAGVYGYKLTVEQLRQKILDNRQEYRRHLADLFAWKEVDGNYAIPGAGIMREVESA